MGWPLGDLRRKGAEGQPSLRVQEGKEVLPFLRAEHGYDPHASGGAMEGEAGHDILAGVLVPEAQKLLSPVLSE